MKHNTTSNSRNKLYLYLTACIFGSLTFFDSCANIKTISAASTSAITVLKTYNDIGYNFTYSFKQYVIPNSIYSGIDTTSTINVPDLSYSTSDLSSALKADKAIGMFFNSLISYFQGISQLSNNELIDYDFSSLADSVESDNQLMGKIGATKKQVDASSKIVTVATNAVMNTYREKKLRKIIVQHDSDVTNVIQAINTTLTILIKNSGDDSLLIINKYALILGNPTVEKSAKVTAIDNYTHEMTDLQNKKIMLITLIQGLQKIGEGNHALAESLRNKKLTSQDVINLIQQHAGDVYAVYGEIQQLKTKN